MNGNIFGIALVATMTVALALPSHAAEPKGILVKPPAAQQSVRPIDKPSATRSIHAKCPDRVAFLVDVNEVPGWEKQRYSAGGKIDRAKITFQPIYGKDSLLCMMGELPMAAKLVEKGSCVVGPDNMSFICKPPIIK